MAEKFISATQTQVATKVSTKTKVLLGIAIVLCASGIFAIVGGLSNEANDLLVNKNQEPTIVNKAIIPGITINQDINQSNNDNMGKVICTCSDGKKCGSTNYDYSGTVGDITTLCAQCCANLGGTCTTVTIKTIVSCVCKNGEKCYTAEVTPNYEVSDIVTDCGTCCTDRKNSSYGSLTWQ